MRAWFSWSAAALVWLLLAFGLPLAAETADLVTVAGFPLGFFLCAQAGPMLLAALAVWLLAWPACLTRLSETAVSRGTGVALTGLVLSPVIVVAIFSKLSLDGFDGLIWGQGVLAGIALFALAMARPLSRSERVGALASSLASTLERRMSAEAQPSIKDDPIASRDGTTGRDVPHARFRSGALIRLSVLALVPLLAAHIFLAARLVSSLASGGLAWSEAIAATSLAALLAAVVLPPRWTLSLLSLAVIGWLCGLIGLSVMGQMQLSATGSASSAQLGLPQALSAIPQWGYGAALFDIAHLERDLVVAGLSDPVTNHAYARPWTTVSMRDGLLSILAIASAVAALLYLARVALLRPALRGDETSSATPTVGWHWMSVTTALIIITAPALASQLRLAELSAFRGGVTEATLPPGIARAISDERAKLCRRSEDASGQPATVPAAPDGAQDGDVPEWWFDDGEATNSTAQQDGAGSVSGQPITAQSIDRLISEHAQSEPGCFGPAPMLALGDIRWTIWSGRLSAFGIVAPVDHGDATSRGLPGGVSWAIEAFAALALISGLAGLLALVRLSSGWLSEHDQKRRRPGAIAAVMASLTAAAAAWALGSAENSELSGLARLGAYHLGDGDTALVQSLSTLTLGLLAASVIPVAAGTALINGRRAISGVMAGALGAGLVIAYWAAPDVLASPLMPDGMVQAIEPVSNAPSWKFVDLASLSQACSDGRADACGAAATLAQTLVNIGGLTPLAFAALSGMMLIVLLTLWAMALRGLSRLASRQA